MEREGELVLVVLLLLAASVIAVVLGERVEALAILTALLLNAGIGFLTEWRARASLAKLRALAVPQALVRRDRRVVRIHAADVVPGDLLVLEAGAHVPADARLVRSARLRTTEGTLTGESVPVDKDADARLAAETPLARSKMRTSGLPSQPAIWRVVSNRRAGARTFGPHCRRRSAASAEVRPGSVP